MARRNDTPAEIAARIAAKPTALGRQRLRRLAARSLQAVLGDERYHRLWLRWSNAPPETEAELGYTPGGFPQRN